MGCCSSAHTPKSRNPPFSKRPFGRTSDHCVTVEPPRPATVRVPGRDRSARANYILEVPSPQSILPAEGINLRRTVRREDTRRAYAAGSPPRDSSPPGELSRDRLRLPRGRTTRLSLAARHANRGQSILPVSPFVVVACPAPPVGTPAKCSLPCKHFVRPPGRLLLRPLSQTAGFQTPHRPGEAPGTSPAPAVLPALAISFVLWVTSLEGVIPRDRRRCVQPSQAGAVCTVRRCRASRHGDFGGPNVEASPYPSASVVRGSAPSPHGTHWQALAGLSWLSYSPPDGLRPVAGMVIPVRPVARREAPHASRVERSR